MDDYLNYDMGQMENLEVLNISNFNAKGDLVLNDEKLLELLQIYPFLYNPRVKPFQDPDYNDWAWNNIATALNKTYNSYTINEPFSVPSLKRRWEFLQPIVMRLSKSYDTKSIPPTLRNHVVKISVQLDNQTTDLVQKTFSDAQRIILDNIEMVEKLPIQQRKQLEAEMMRLILTSELEAKATVKSNGIMCQNVEQECKEFFKDIGIPDDINEADEDALDNMEKIVIPSPPASQKKDITNGTNVLKTVPPLRIKLLNTQPQIDYSKGSLSATTNRMLSNNPLLMPLDRPRWVELDQVPYYIRKCRVRLKRCTPPEDDIPLSRIKEENWWY